MAQIRELPISDAQRFENRQPNTWQEWLECMGLEKAMFTNEQLQAIEKGCIAANKRGNK